MLSSRFTTFESFILLNGVLVIAVCRQIIASSFTLKPQGDIIFLFLFLISKFTECSRLCGLWPDTVVVSKLSPRNGWHTDQIDLETPFHDEITAGCNHLPDTLTFILKCPQIANVMFANFKNWLSRFNFNRQYTWKTCYFGNARKFFSKAHILFTCKATNVNKPTF